MDIEFDPSLYDKPCQFCGEKGIHKCDTSESSILEYLENKFIEEESTKPPEKRKKSVITFHCDICDEDKMSLRGVCKECMENGKGY